MSELALANSKLNIFVEIFFIIIKYRLLIVTIKLAVYSWGIKNNSILKKKSVDSARHGLLVRWKTQQVSVLRSVRRYSSFCAVQINIHS